MAIQKLSIYDAYKHETEALTGWYYQLPEVDGGRSVIYAEVRNDHGTRVVGAHPRIYYIIDGEGEFTINGEKTSVQKGDVIIIPARSTYGYFATKPVLKLLLVMDLIDLTKLPPSKEPKHE